MGCHNCARMCSADLGRSQKDVPHSPPLLSLCSFHNCAERVGIRSLPSVGIFQLCSMGFGVGEPGSRRVDSYAGSLGGYAQTAFGALWSLGAGLEILLAVGIAVSFACILLSRQGFYDRAMDADRGVELSLAIVIVCVFLFLRYYGLEAKVPDRQLALGFCLYSSFFVIDFRSSNDICRRVGIFGISWTS